MNECSVYLLNLLQGEGDTSDDGLFIEVIGHVYSVIVPELLSKPMILLVDSENFLHFYRFLYTFLGVEKDANLGGFTLVAK
jgi:hypothetical protein